MESEFIVGAQISSLFPTQVTAVTIQTARQKIPLPPTPRESDPPLEHAIYSSVTQSQTTGTVVLRVLHGGLIVELISLSTTIAPIRLVFPAKVLPTPAVYLWNSELHVIAITDTGSLYRVVIPIGAAHELWQPYLHTIWPREYCIKGVPEKLEGLVHVHGVHCVALSLPNGALLRLETDYLGSEGDEDEWSEYVHQHTSFLSSLTSFLPLGSSIPGASDIVAIATHPWPTDLGHIWTISRDRTLKLWKAKIGCVASKQLGSVVRDASPGLGTQMGKSHALLSPEYQSLLRVFSTTDDEHIYLLAFLPSATASTSGGTFTLLNAVSDQPYEIGTIECTKNTAHCHLQDFMVINDTLYTLWDRQGQSMVERTVINVVQLDEEGKLQTSPWQSASYAPEPELTPAYLEEQLLGPGSMASKFFEAIMRPGVFSPLTLRNAIDQYSDACLSLPGPPPPQLTTTYATIGENIAAVVGCTVHLNRDPQTGTLQYVNYWNALKRDWEGFIARCREIERSSRWPLVLGIQDQGEILVVERERIGLVVLEDVPIRLTRSTPDESRSRDRQYDLFVILATLRTTLGPQDLSGLENRLADIMHQEIAFPIVDIIQDQARRFNIREQLDEGATTWVIGRLQAINDLDGSMRTAIDIIGGLNVEVKQEEDEVELLLPPPNSDFSRALVANYVAVAVNARYTLCLSLFILLFFLSDELNHWDASLLGEIFALFRGIAMLRFIAKHPAGPAEPPITDPSPDDVIAKLRNMDVSRNQTEFIPTYSLVHRLLGQSDNSSGLPVSAHRFLDNTGLLQSISPSHVTQFEVSMCERLRTLGFFGVSQELLSWLPRTPGVIYVLARLWLDIGRPDDTAQLFQRLAGAFGPDRTVLVEDQEAMAGVIPSNLLLDTDFAFYVHAATLFREANITCHEVAFSQLAIEVAPDIDISPLWNTVIRGYIELGQYTNAYAALIASPYDKQKRDCISQLAYRMCEDNKVEDLMSFTFAGMADEVEDALAFKARNVDPRIRPSYSRILYAWYIHRGDYRSAALTMYQRARKFQDINTPGTQTFLGEQLEAYLVAINALSLLESQNSWFCVPLPIHSDSEARKRRKLSKHIPESKYTAGTHDVEFLTLGDLQEEYMLLSAQIDLVKRDPTLLATPDPGLPASIIVLKLAQSNRFNQAMATARSLKVDMTDLFTHLTGQCLRLTRNADTVIQEEDTSDWLLTDKVSSWAGSPADRGWRYLRQSLERHDSAETDYKYTKTTLDTILSLDRSASPPPWLMRVLQEHHHEYLIRAFLRYEKVDQAVEHTLSLIRKADSRMALDPPKNASATWLPYTLIDQVLFAATSQEFPPARLVEIRSEITSRVKRMERFAFPPPPAK